MKREDVYFEFGEFDSTLTMFSDGTGEPLAQVGCGSEYMNGGEYAKSMETACFNAGVGHKDNFITFQCGSCERVFYVPDYGRADRCHYCGSGNFCEGYIDDEVEV